MTTEVSSQALISITERTLVRLMEVRRSANESLAEVVERLLTNVEPLGKERETGISQERDNSVVGERTPTSSSKYCCEVLAHKVHAGSLGELFGEVVDVFDALAPEVLETLSERRLAKRRHLSRHRDSVHFGTRDLPVLRTRAGWWVSKNVSEAQTVAHLRALCEVAGLVFGNDVIYPARSAQ